ncbi:MAG: segregation/condensation protein A [Candidatus Latescibacterota bacterium]|nr:MAG: segregation/condensation protein A [Candidatus Latescibacterota bacterium]
MAPMTEEIRGTGYRVELDAFQGPLDLLLYLIKRDEIDIYDIPIARVTEQYLAHIRIMQMLDLEVAGEFLVMASTLMRIKAKMLLPRAGAEEGEEEDPRDELVRRLIEYRRYKHAAEKLRDRAEERGLLYGRAPAENGETEEAEPGELLIPVDLVGLLRTFARLMERAPRLEPYEVLLESYTLEEKIERIESALEGTDRIEFESLFEPGAVRREVIVTFIAVLELLRLQRIGLVQAGLFGRIWIRRRSETEDGSGSETEPEPLAHS